MMLSTQLALPKDPNSAPAASAFQATILLASADTAFGMCCADMHAISVVPLDLVCHSTRTAGCLCPAANHQDGMAQATAAGGHWVS